MEKYDYQRLVHEEIYMIHFIKRKILQKYVDIKINNMKKISTDMNIIEANNNLRSFYSKEYPDFIQENEICATVDLQIIIPVYNVEKYIVECIDSVLSQKTKYTYHIVIINDGSTDNSLELINNYKNNSNITIINCDNNGVSKARNIGLKYIKGRYVMFMDSDDKLVPETVEKLLDTAYDFAAQIVEGGHQTFKDSEKLDVFTHGVETFRCNRLDLFGYPWGKVIRNDCLKNFCFPEGYLFEDTVMSTLLYPECNKIYCIPDIVYLYRINENGITIQSSNNIKSIDTYWITKYCLEERIKRGQMLDVRDFERYLQAVYRNWGRTKNISLEIQESIFVLTCNLLENIFQHFLHSYSGKYKVLTEIIQCKSFEAFLVLMENWWLIMSGK